MLHPANQPNILLLFADQHRADCLAVNGHPFVETPNLDRLAGDGCNFIHAYTPSPICTPARTSLLTGLWATQHGCIANTDTEVFRAMLPGLPTFSQALKAEAYWLALIGKWGVDPLNPPTVFGFDRYIAEKEYVVWRKQQGAPPKPFSNRFFGETDPHITPEQSALAWGANQVIEQMQHANATGKPFFIQWCPSEPHLPNVVPEPYASMYPPASIPPWPNFPDPLTDKPYIQRQQKVTWGIDQWTWADWSPIVGRYLGEVSLLDAQIGRILAELERLGIGENTLVIYSCDHGDFTGSHGLIDKHYAMYEELVRVPLILRWPGHIAAGQTCDAFVSSTLDLASTICDAAKAPIPTTFMGQSLLALAASDTIRNASDAFSTSPQFATRNSIFSTYHGNQFGLFSQRMLRERGWKYVYNASDIDELYDLERDPAEMTNRINDSSCAEDLQRLRHLLVEWMEKTEDRLLNDWTKNTLLSGRKL